MYAVIQTGGKQYRVEPGKTVVVEKLAGDKGTQVVFDQVLLVSSGDGGSSAASGESSIARGMKWPARQANRWSSWVLVPRRYTNVTLGPRSLSRYLRVRAERVMTPGRPATT